MDIAATLEKIDKRNEKLKESLSTRRRDRINPNELKGFSILDLAVAYDQDAKAVHIEKMDRLRKEEKNILEKREDYTGNRHDTEEITKDDSE